MEYSPYKVWLFKLCFGCGFFHIHHLENICIFYVYNSNKTPLLQGWQV